jgi:carbon storage regulator
MLQSVTGLSPWLTVGRELLARIPPEFWSDPAAQIGRIGDVILWKGSTGQRVIATLEGVAESQQRIDSAVAGIESTQLGTLSVLSTMQHLSMATFGLTALSAGLMLWRFNALNKRIDQLGGQLRDLESHHDAQEKSKLLKGLQCLRDFEDKHESSSLEKAYVIDGRNIIVRVGTVRSDKAELRILAPDGLRICQYGADRVMPAFNEELGSETETVQRDPSSGWAAACRQKGEWVVVGTNVRITVIEIRNHDHKVRLGIEAPKEMTVYREEYYDAILREQEEKGK